jgi:hypothetical protein
MRRAQVGSSKMVVGNAIAAFGKITVDMSKSSANKSWDFLQEDPGWSDLSYNAIHVVPDPPLVLGLELLSGDGPGLTIFDDTAIGDIRMIVFDFEIIDIASSEIDVFSDAFPSIPIGINNSGTVPIRDIDDPVVSLIDSSPAYNGRGFRFSFSDGCDHPIGPLGKKSNAKGEGLANA